MQTFLGAFIENADQADESLFAGATIFIKEHNADGAVGFISNRLSGRSLHELEEFKKSSYFPLHYGGPVAEEHLFFLHRRPDLISGSQLVYGTIYWGGSFDDVVDCINSGRLTGNDVRIFIGYCGWDAGELEAELNAGCWRISTEDTNLFS